jgi:acyl carrier protein
VPIGVAGEIYIGGIAVACGYLGRPELTAERFVTDPFSADARATMYKTGDLGRWRANGTLEYLGRNDDQVKIRGYRIELAEIEDFLARHAKVKDVAVVAREDVPGERQLVAYVTRAGDAAPSPKELRAYLESALPAYVIPSAFVALDHLPLSPNGKLDRRALPAPDRRAYLMREYEAPEGEVEAAIAGVWQELLRVERVGRGDNFFDLGGHSLLATRIVTHLNQLLDIELPLKALFERPTIEGLAEIVLRDIDDELTTELS